MRKPIKRLVGPLARRSLSPTTVQKLRFRSWYISSYLPRLVGANLIGRSAEVRRFGMARVSSSLATELQAVNLLAPTGMCRVMAKYGSDKAKNGYTPLYSALFKERYDQPLQIVELGMGTNNPNLLSNMGVFGAPGASLRGWRQLFPHALVYGADIDRQILFEEDRIKTYFCDQLDQSSIHELWSREELKDGADIIIEDGLHTFEANISFLEASIDYLRPGGTYIVEDIESVYIDKWCTRLESIYAKQYPDFEFVFVIQADPGPNNLLVARRMLN